LTKLLNFNEIAQAEGKEQENYGMRGRKFKEKRKKEDKTNRDQIKNRKRQK
jgi:hypothetical protein